MNNTVLKLLDTMHMHHAQMAIVISICLNLFERDGERERRRDILEKNNVQ